ncbi:MAG: MTH1187 family thiamine-binding protein, partial [Firmicutes bacterium]|nr:MTH1187 family thiamine-binding protein [Bacillota bacterium]
MAVADVTVVPLGTGSTSLSTYIAACQRELQQHGAGLKFELTAMGTIIEGDLELILALARRLHEAPFKQGAARVTTTIRIDDRRDKAATAAGKLKSVQEKM